MQNLPLYCKWSSRSRDSGKLPHIWKEANVSPIFKTGDKSDPANYRPIPLTCVLCKVLEHIVASNLTEHLDNSNILFELQHGFKEKRSCETQSVMLVDKTAKNMQMGKQTDLIILDFSKAFDKVAHEKLISKLHFYGIRGKTLSWVKDFGFSFSSCCFKWSQMRQDSSIFWCPVGLSPWTHTLPSIYKWPTWPGQIQS